MVTTRIAPPKGPCGLSHTHRRNRVDPLKLLDLIERVRAAAETKPAPPAQPTTQTTAKAG